ncbi:hypothetical protein [Caulobacter sp. 17J65-9]|uniref:hypothetical protein n=1 Tax=Caulobacter sp. 17J65-9 TaxID=2709382 RepID=UPI0013C60F30|nr:hypothetical protein [Caulobacter sp. 17J65-9]NEX91221.1 hypothetical protein [Caulobacter sp. 17J65-9]
MKSKTEDMRARKLGAAAAVVGLAVGICALSATGVIAGTDTTFDPATAQVEGWINGSLGKLVTIAAIGSAVVNIVTAFNWKFIAGALGVGVTAGLGPQIAGSFVTAIF